MNHLPKPMNIRANWRERPIGLFEAAAELAIRYRFIDSYGEPVEARAWERRMGCRKGSITRVDVAFQKGGKIQFASLRMTGRAGLIRLGEIAAV